MDEFLDSDFDILLNPSFCEMEDIYEDYFLDYAPEEMEDNINEDHLLDYAHEESEDKFREDDILDRAHEELTQQSKPLEIDIKAVDERNTNVPLNETSNNNEEPMSSSTSPILMWTDDKIDEGNFEGFPLLSVDQTNRLGEVMVIMVCLGPLYRVEEIVAVLALNIRDPTYPFSHVFSEAEGRNPPVTGGTKAGTTLFDFASPAVLQDLEKLCEVEKYHTKKEGSVVKARRTSAGYVGRDAVKEFLQWASERSAELRASIFSFLAASLVKSGVKNRIAMGKLWCKTISRKLGSFYRWYENRQIPLLSRRAYKVMNKEFRPGSALLKTILRMFLKKNFDPEVSSTVKGILDFTLLIHTSYNEMKLKVLAERALRYLGFTNVKDISRFDSVENRPGITALVSFYTMYGKGRPLGESKYLPWCRLFDKKYWSSLSPKAHPSLATLLTCVFDDSYKNIWKMNSIKTTEACKAKCREKVKAIVKTKNNL